MPDFTDPNQSLQRPMQFSTTIWDVEHGGAAFVVCPNNKSILFDAGCSESFSPALALRQAGFGPHRRIDQLVISHPDADHINDLPQVYTYLKPRILRRNKTIPDALVYGGPGGTPESEAKRIYKLMHETYVHPIAPSDAAAVALNWGGVEKAFYYVNAARYPELAGGRSCNNYSIVAVLRYGVTTIVFPGDIEAAGMEILSSETDLLQRVSSTEFRILIAPHHGRRAGVSTTFLGAMRPSLTIMSDVHGAETTDYRTYTDYSQGLKVVDSETAAVRVAKIVTTKSNSAIHLLASPEELLVRLY